jgi:dCMP deaminase
MLLALSAAERGTCDRAKVGCVLSKNKRVIATGYNGSVHGDDHCEEVGHQMVDGHCIRTIHAEINALIQCALFGTVCVGAVAYVTHFPCYGCAKALVQAGIQKIYYNVDYRPDPNTKSLLQKAGIETEFVAAPNTKEVSQ